VIRRSSTIGRKFSTFRVLTAALTLTLVSSTLLPPQAAAVPIDDAVTIDDVKWSEEFQPEHADILRLYRAFFNREADAAEAKYWINEYESGANMDEIAWVFASGPEFQNRYGATTDVEFLTIAYNNILGRAYDQAGFDYWLDQIQTGALTRESVVRWIAASPEFRARRPQAPAEHYANTLLTQADLPNYDLSTQTTFEPRALEGCAGWIGMPNGAVETTWNHSDGSGQFVFSGAIPLRTEAEAIDYFNNYLAPHFLYCAGEASLPSTNLGEAAFAAEKIGLDGGLQRWDFVRQDNVVLYLITDGVDTARARTLLTTMHNRL